MRWLSSKRASAILTLPARLFAVAHRGDHLVAAIQLQAAPGTASRQRRERFAERAGFSVAEAHVHPARKSVGHEGLARRELHEEGRRAVEQVALTVGGSRFVPFEMAPLSLVVGIGERDGVGRAAVDAAHGRLQRRGQFVAVVEAHDDRHLVGVEGGVLVAVLPVLADDPPGGLVESRGPGRAVVSGDDHRGPRMAA